MEVTKKSPFQMSSFRVVKHVTRPLLKITDNKQYYIMFENPLKQAEQVKNPKTGADGNVVPPPFIIDVLNLEDGISMQMVANEVLKSELEKQYPDATYVGKYFEIVKNTRAEGKRYNTFGITELELVNDEPVNDEPVNVEPVKNEPSEHFGTKESASGKTAPNKVK